MKYLNKCTTHSQLHKKDQIFHIHLFKQLIIFK